MEYLMTYGWAILIIAIVMVALFQLGVFNGTFFAPHATAGACEVYRSVEGTNLVGQCQGELPQFVATFAGSNSYITGSGSALELQQQSIIAWVYPTTINTCDEILSTNPFGVNSGFEFKIDTSNEQSGFEYGSSAGYQTNTWINTNYPLNTWTFVAITFNAGVINWQINNKMLSPITNVNAAISYTQNGFAMGSLLNGNNCGIGASLFGGSIANVQIYNTSLSANEVSALYAEGIGGAPIDPTHIVGWWPLNGNAQDYSGNNNNGVPTAMNYTSAWASGYMRP